MKTNGNLLHKTYRPAMAAGMLLLLLGISACTKTIKIGIPDSAKQIVVDGSIELNTPPVILLTKSQTFFTTANLNDLGSYFVHGAKMKITASDGTSTDLEEFCLQDLHLSASQSAVLLSALGYTSADSNNVVNVCAYTVPDIINYYLTGSCNFMGKERTSYKLDIVSPALSGNDSVHLTATTTIPRALGIDSLVVRPDPDPKTADSMAAIYVYVSVPDTFGNFLRYKTKRNNEPFYTPKGGSVYDDKLFVGLTVSLPLERGTAPDADFDINTDTYFWKGDTVTLKWSNIDSKTYQFFYTLENDGGGSPFASPIKIQGNVENGLGVWAGYATKYYSIIVPK